MIVIPDVEAAVIGHLVSVLPEPVWVSTQVPNPRAADMVRVQCAGGAGVVDFALADVTLTVECWGADSVTASALARRCAAELEAWTGASLACSTPRSFPDPLTALPRYLFTASGVMHTASL